MLLVVGANLTFAAVASAAPQTVIDQGGEDDLTGQKDLNSLTVDYGLPRRHQCQPELELGRHGNVGGQHARRVFSV